MRNIIHIFKSDVRGLFRNFFALVIAAGLCILPALYAWFNIYANWNPYGSTGNIRIAVASLDEGWTNGDGEELNMGDNIVESLKEKDSIGWVFTDTEKEAVDGVYAGKYYAAVVIDPDFTYSMYHGFAENMEDPKITYYVNDKKNAVATKITDTAVSTLQASIDQEFVKAATERIFTETNGISAEFSGEDAVEKFIENLETVNESLMDYDEMISSFIEGNEILSDAASDANTGIAEGKEVIDTGIRDLEEGQKSLDTASGSFQEFSGAVSTSLQDIQDSLELISKEIGDAQLEQDAAALAADVETIIQDAKGLSDDLGGLAETLDNVQGESGSLANTIQGIQDIKGLADGIANENNVPAAGEITQDAVRLMQEALANYSDSVEQMDEMYRNHVVPQVNGVLSNMSEALETVGTILTSLSDTADSMGDVFTGVGTTLDTLNMSLLQLQTVIENTSGRLTDVLERLNDASESEQLDIIMNFLTGDPETYGRFFSEPVQVEENYIYEIANYGSGVAPFYSVLAIWVGMTVLVSLIKVHAGTDGMKEVKPYQLYFGRYLIFFVLSQIQALIIVLGDLFILKIQCREPLAFWLAAAMTSLTFSLLVYSLTIAFGDIGKAFAVVIMVIQIAGSGGTYPIEALPSFFRAVYIFFPFPYAIDAMRECIGGMYRNSFSICLAELAIFCAASLLIGLVVRIPFMGLNHFIEKRMEDTKML